MKLKLSTTPKWIKFARIITLPICLQLTALNICKNYVALCRPV